MQKEKDFRKLLNDFREITLSINTISLGVLSQAINHPDFCIKEVIFKEHMIKEDNPSAHDIFKFLLSLKESNKNTEIYFLTQDPHHNKKAIFRVTKELLNQPHNYLLYLANKIYLSYQRYYYYKYFRARSFNPLAFEIYNTMRHLKNLFFNISTKLIGKDDFWIRHHDNDALLLTDSSYNNGDDDYNFSNFRRYLIHNVNKIQPLDFKFKSPLEHFKAARFLNKEVKQ